MKKLKKKLSFINVAVTVLIIACIVLLITLFVKRDLPEKPIIDVVISSIATIASGVIAASVAYFVANMQIKHSLLQEEIKKKKKLYSRIKLVIYELSFIADMLETVIEGKEDEEQKLDYLKANISTRIWDNISIDLIDDLDAELFNQIINTYFDLNILLQEYNSDLLKRVYTDSIKIKTRLEAFLDNSPTSQ